MADGWQIHDSFYADAIEMCRVSDPRDLKQLGRVQRSSGQNGLSRNTNSMACRLRRGSKLHVTFQLDRSLRISN